MRRIGLTIAFSDPDGPTHSESREIEVSYGPDLSHQERIARILFAELKIMAGPQATPKHNAVARSWSEFPKRQTELIDYFNFHNARELWFELTNLVMGAEGSLILARAFKALEPAEEPSFDDDANLNELFYVHSRKMSSLNQAVHDLIKVQDLVNRLLHESLGGDLVDTTDTDWETELRRKKVMTGLESKRIAGLISQTDFDAICQALKIPNTTPNGLIALTYRNKLAHHVRPSVDYSMFYSALESRGCAETRDADGKLIATHITLRSRPPVQYRFQDLHAAFSEYLDAIVLMLENLSKVELLRR
jgi:hypothetical protein